MNALVDVVVRLLGDLLVMPQIFLREVVLTDPISAILVAFGTLFVGGAVGVFGYVVLGAFATALPQIGRAPPAEQRE